jgi:hypothetical protein
VTEFGMHEAKTHLSRLVERARNAPVMARYDVDVLW